MAKARKTASKASHRSEKKSGKKFDKRILYLGLGVLGILLIGGLVWLSIGIPKAGEAWAAPNRICSSQVPCANTQYGTSGATTKWCRQINGNWQWSYCAKCGTTSWCSDNGYWQNSLTYGDTARCLGLELICDDDNNFVQCNSANAAVKKQVSIPSGYTVITYQCGLTDGYYKWSQVSSKLVCTQHKDECVSEGQPLWCGAGDQKPTSGSPSYSRTWCTDSDGDGCLEITHQSCNEIGMDWCLSSGVCTKQ